MAGPRAGTRGTRTGGGHRVGSSSGGASRGASGGSRPGGFRPVGGPRPGRGPRPRPHHGGPMHHHHHGGPAHHHHHHHPVRPPRHHHHHHHHHSGGYRRGPSLVAYLLVAIIIVAIVVLSNCDRQQWMSKREKIKSGNKYTANCVIDQIEWVDNPQKVGEELKSFWKKTGVQPHILFKAYDAQLDTDEKKDQWTMDYYDSNFTQEDVFVYVYFAEENLDDVGYMSYACGRDASKVMDDEAVDIFWQYIDEYWFDDKLTTDELIINVFNKTAKKIM